MFNKLAMLLTPLLLLGVFLEGRTFTTPEDAAPYHGAVRAAVEAIPYRVGGWEGSDATVPEPAQKLLRPNAILARLYRHRESGHAATLILVQCRDTRDLAGHYPPVCYPGSGWTKRGQTDTSIDAPGGGVPVRRYAFSRSRFDRETNLVVYSFFVIPGRGRVRDMEAVYNAASDYQGRAFGAAQVQVVLTEVLPEDEERRIAAELLGPAGPAMVVVERGREGGAS